MDAYSERKVKTWAKFSRRVSVERMAQHKKAVD